MMNWAVGGHGFMFRQEERSYEFHRYTAFLDGVELGQVFKDWYDTGRTRTFDWVTEPATGRWARRDDAANALAQLVQDPQ